MPTLPSWLLDIAAPLFEQILKEAVNAGEAKRVLILILSKLESFVATEEKQASGPFKDVETAIGDALQSALAGTIAALNA